MENYINKILHGDCLEKLKELPDNSIDSILTDPPYGLSFMGKKWDYDVPSVEIWKECLRVLKPGGYLLSFAGTRTQHRMAVRIEDAGFEIRDMIAWVYSTGFPKSLNVYKQLQKNCKCGNMEVYDNERTEQNTEHNLRPMSETDLSQEVHFDTEQGKVLFTGLSEQSISLQQSESTENVRGEKPLLEGRNNNKKTKGELQGSDLSKVSEEVFANGEKGRLHNSTQTGNGSTSEQTTNENGSGASYRPQSEQQQDRKPCAFCKQWGTQKIRRAAEENYGVGTALKPALEPITVARKPLEGTVAENCLKWGVGGINIDGCRVGTEDTLGRKGGWNPNGYVYQAEHGSHKSDEYYASGDEKGGRFPANLIHDGSDEVVSCFPNNSQRFFYCAKASKSERNRGCEGLEIKQAVGGGGGIGDYLDDVNSASGKFGSEKAPAKNNHPTVKPIALMEYLVKLVSKEGHLVLDPFAGSGSTLIACQNLKRNYIGIEREADYITIANARLSIKK